MSEQPKNQNDAGAASTGGPFFREINVEFLIHELKGPLSVIDTAVRMLLEKREKFGSLSDRQEKALQRARRNAVKAGNLLADLLEVGRSDAGCFQCCCFNPAAAVDEVLLEAVEPVDTGLLEALLNAETESQRSDVLQRHGIRISCSDEAGAAVLCQDETKFRQIVSNLVRNALQHRCRCLEVSLDCREGLLTVDVADDGPGVEKQDQERIFQRYTRLEACVALSRTGHGLGLAGARIIARHLGGDITITNRHGGGACFRLTLPLNFSISP